MGDVFLSDAWFMNMLLVEVQEVGKEVVMRFLEVEIVNLLLEVEEMKSPV